jgi:hypothetical protein
MLPILCVKSNILKQGYIILFIALIFIFTQVDFPFCQSLDIPVKGYGISFGNSKKFAGLRFNFRDRRVDRIDGINVTLWKADENEDAIIRGIPVGIMPEAGDMGYLQFGIAGVAAGYQLSGLSVGILGVGSGGDMDGINIGGLGAGAGRNVTGINIGGLGVGAGKDLIGINIGGLGTGAGQNAIGFNFALLGVGAGQNLYGINLAGLCAGAGQNMSGLNFGGLAVGAGQNLTGVNIGGLGVGAGQELRGLSFAIIGAGSPSIKGVTVAGFGVGGVEITGLTVALAHVRIEDDGILTGFAASAFTYIKGLLRGVSLGIVNYAYEVNGIQIGLVNYVADNPSGLKILPLFNTSF